MNSEAALDSALDRMLDLYVARISKLESDLAMVRADLLLCNEANKECLRELSGAIADCKIACHAYITGNDIPKKIIKRYLPEGRK